METGGKEDPLKLGLLSIVARAAFFNTLKTGCIPFFRHNVFFLSRAFSRVFLFWQDVLSKGHLWQYVVQGHLNVGETGVRVSWDPDDC